MKKRSPFFLYSFLLCLVLIPLSVLADDGSDSCASVDDCRDKHKALTLKIGALVSILLCGSIGVLLPLAGKFVPALRPEQDGFFAVKAFAAGVILATGFIHVLPDAFENLSSSCLSDHPWHDFPFAGFIALGTLMIDAFATGYYNLELSNAAPLAEGDEEAHGSGAVHMHADTHATHGHSHGPGAVPVLGKSDELVRHRIISQVLELGIVVHSVIIGISLGASESPCTIKPLVAALSFHQFFEGMGLGGCIVQTKFKSKATAIMALFFSLPTPVGIVIGTGISSTYNENGPTALIVEGVFNSSSAGILIYMALVDLLAADFMAPRMQNSGKLQILANVSLLLGAGLMSLLAKWA
ncbi:unnamed protein product [Victoria cruziana]